MCFALILAAILGPFADEPSPSPSPLPLPLKPDVAAYNEAAAKAGKSADAQVRVALWCEAHGMTAERAKHLSLAVLYEPTNTLARGLMGLVAYQGKWARPDEVSPEVQDDLERKARIKEYLKRRVELKERADDHWKLALWCQQNGLKDQASVHFRRVVQLDPKRESAWKHLGFKKLGGHWVKPDNAAAAKVEAQRQKKANEHWRPILERLRTSLQSKDASRRADAERALTQITDRRAVPMVWATFGRGNASLQKVAVQVLGQIDDPSASRSLVMLAVFGGSAEVRRKAVDRLRQRNAREFAGVLIAMIQQPIKYKVKQVGGPGQPGELFIYGQGSTPNLRRLYSPPAAPSVALQPGDQLVTDQNGSPVINRQVDNVPLGTTLPAFEAGMRRQVQLQAQRDTEVAALFTQSGLSAQSQNLGRVMMNAMERNATASQGLYPSVLYNLRVPVTQFGAPTPISGLSFNFAVTAQIPIGQMAVSAQQTAAAAGQQLQNDVNAIDQYNNSLGESTGRVVPVLNDISGQNLGPEPVAWQAWLNNLVGFNSLQASEPPTVTEDVPLAYQPPPIPVSAFGGLASITRVSCFGAGTMVRTLTGSTPIESLNPGDQVLTQSVKTGSLAYKPILVVHHNPPSKTYQMKLGEEMIVSSYFHRFWKAGSGLVMARDLKVGDPIRTLSGTVNVTAIEHGRVVPVFNLDVADDADFFVGEIGALAHDNTVPDLREVPFDAVTTPVHADSSSRD